MIAWNKRILNFIKTSTNRTSWKSYNIVERHYDGQNKQMRKRPGQSFSSTPTMKPNINGLSYMLQCHWEHVLLQINRISHLQESELISPTCNHPASLIQHNPYQNPVPKLHVKTIYIKTQLPKKMIQRKNKISEVLVLHKY